MKLPATPLTLFPFGLIVQGFKDQLTLSASVKLYSVSPSGLLAKLITVKLSVESILNLEPLEGEAEPT